MIEVAPPAPDAPRLHRAASLFAIDAGQHGGHRVALIILFGVLSPGSFFGQQSQHDHAQWR
jgi:hypothetical protein